MLSYQTENTSNVSTARSVWIPILKKVKLEKHVY